MARRVYKARKGSGFTDSDAAVIGPELHRITSERGGQDPHQIVEEARRESSPLHPYFEWDRAKAAARWNLHQARTMYGAILIRVVSIDRGRSKQVELRAFYNIVQSEETDSGVAKRRTYVTFDQVRQTPDFANQVIDDAVREIALWRARYLVYMGEGVFRTRFRRLMREIGTLVDSNGRPRTGSRRRRRAVRSR